MTSTAGRRSEAGSNAGIVVRVTADRALLRSFLEPNRIAAAQQLCEVEGLAFDLNRWYVALRDDRVISALCEYAGRVPQPLAGFGEPEGIEAILHDSVKPKAAYFLGAEELLPAVATQYRVDPGPPVIRMWVDRAHFRPRPGPAQRLHAGDIAELNRLYGLGFTTWLPAGAIEDGVYYGIWIGSRLAAAAGTHAVSEQAGLGVVGNVLTHSQFRGRGFATITTGAVTAELLRFCDTVVLNVRSDNPPAIQAYRRLGFQEHSRLEERLIHRLGGLPGFSGPLRRILPIGDRQR